MTKVLGKTSFGKLAEVGILKIEQNMETLFVPIIFYAFVSLTENYHHHITENGKSKNIQRSHRRDR